MWTPRRPGSRLWSWPGGCPCRRSCWTAQLSGGEQQRVAIARGLTMDRRLLLADEPTGNLDSENSDNIIDLLLKLAHDENRCVIVVTHDLSVMDRADVVYRINDGLLERR